MTKKEFDNLPMIMTVKDVKEVLQIGTNSVYELIKQKNFPVLVLSERKIRIPKDEFVEWIKKSTKNYQIIN